VSRRVTEAIEAKRGNTEYDLEKLLQLIHELNQNFAQHHPYACHALLRAVLDHVPPIFGKAHFGAVAANHTWSRTDAKYIKFLAEFKVQADDVLHRPISSSASFIEMDDLPPRARVNALLTEVVKLL
jgi:UDP-N-acetylmuramate-alanine ligase